MANCGILAWYGYGVLILTAGFVLVPYLRRKGELFSAWNLLLIGVAIFLGLGSLEAAYSPMRFRGLDWFEPTRQEVTWYLTASTIFLITLFLAYYFDPVSRYLARRSLNNWPQVSTPSILFVLAFCAAVIIAVPIVKGLPFIGAATLKLSHKAIVFVSVFSFILWYRQKLNLLWLLVFVAAFALMCLLAMLSGGGRRLVLSVMVTPVIVFYYARMRYWRPTRAMAVAAAATAVMLLFTFMYSSIRHFDRGRNAEARSAANLVNRLKSLPQSNWQKYASDNLFFFGQQSVHYALITDRYIDLGRLEPQFLNTLKFLAVYPVPRQMWANKPRQLGIVILRDAVGYPTSSWGCSISGHARYEGGLWVAALYAYLAVIGVRLIDDPLQRQPMNPYLLSILATASMHIIAWPRGDLANMTLEVAQCFIFAIILGVFGRFIFGTERTDIHAPSMQLVWQRSVPVR